MTKTEIGRATARIYEDVVEETLGLVSQYRRQLEPNPIDFIKQAVDTPSRAKARLQEWIDQYDADNGSGSGVLLLNECLSLSGSSETVGSINTAIASLETKAAIIVDNVNNNGWTWDQVADAVEANIAPEVGVELSYLRLPIPPGYTTVWGDPW